MTRAAAARLVRLYPAAWRARYGDEFAHVLEEQGLTPRLLVDVAGGAIDARLQRGWTTAAAAGADMTTKLMKRCADGGPALSNADAWRANGVLVGSSLIFAALYILAKIQLGDRPIVDALGVMAFPAALFVSMPFSYMKHASVTTKVLTVGTCLAILVGASYLSVLI